MRKHVLLCTIALLGALLIRAPQAQIKEFRTDHAVIQEREQIPESVIEWADLHQVWEIKIEYGLEVRGRGITTLLFDGEGHVMVDYQEKGDKQK